MRWHHWCLTVVLNHDRLTIPDSRGTIPVMSGTTEQSWRDVVASLLGAAELTHEDLAASVGLPRSNITRWLRGTVKPTLSSIRDVNKAVARLLKDPLAESYLLTIALWEAGHTESETDIAAQLALAKEGILQELRGYFAVGVEEVLQAWHKSAVKSEHSLLQFGGVMLLVGLEIANNRLKRLQGHVPNRPLAETLLSALEANGLEVKRWLRPEPDVEVLRTRDRFQLSVERTIRTHAQGVQPLARQEIVARILSAYDEASTTLAAISSRSRASRRISRKASRRSNPR